MIQHDNLWTSISPEDYENHMSGAAVNQHKFLSDCFKVAMVKNSPQEILVIGCGTGNGLEHIDPNITYRTTVIDINREFLEVVRQRYQKKIPGLEIMHEDLKYCDFQQESYSMVYAGLVFEFVEPKLILKKLIRVLRQNSKLEVVLQLPNANAPIVSPTSIESVENLNSIIKLVDIQEFCEMCKNMGMQLVNSYIETLDTGKSFFLGSFQKSGV